MPSLRLLPHGGYTLVPAVLSTVAWLLSLSQDGCDYAKITGFVVAEATKNSAVPYLELGFNAFRQPDLDNGKWNVEYSGSCLAYDEEFFDQDGYWVAAKAFAFISLVLGGGGALFLWFSGCCVFSRGTWRWAGYEVLWAAIFQSLAFLWFATDVCREGDNDCSLAYGSSADIASAVLWLTSALCIFCRYPVPKPMEEEEEEIVHHSSDDIDHVEQHGGEDTSEHSIDLPVEGDAEVSMQVEEKKGNETVVQTTPADADIL